MRAWFRARALVTGAIVLLLDPVLPALVVLPEAVAAAQVCGLGFFTTAERAA